MKIYVLLSVASLGLFSCQDETHYKKSGIEFLQVVKDQSIDSISQHFLINPSEDIMFPVYVKSAKEMLLKHGDISVDSLLLDSSQSINEVRRVYFIRLYDRLSERKDYLGLIRFSFPEGHSDKVSVFEAAPKIDNSIRINADSIKAEVLKRHGL